MTLSALKLDKNKLEKVLREEAKSLLDRAVLAIVMGDSSDAGTNGQVDAVSHRGRKPRKRASQSADRHADKQLELFAQSQKKVARKGFSS